MVAPWEMAHWEDAIVGVGVRLSFVCFGCEVIIEDRVDNCLALIVQLGRLEATRKTVPAVKEEDFHGVVRKNRAVWTATAFAASPMFSAASNFSHK